MDTADCICTFTIYICICIYTMSKNIQLFYRKEMVNCDVKVERGEARERGKIK